jgi:hypothetical protein
MDGLPLQTSPAAFSLQSSQTFHISDGNNNHNSTLTNVKPLMLADVGQSGLEKNLITIGMEPETPIQPSLPFLL